MEDRCAVLSRSVETGQPAQEDSKLHTKAPPMKELQIEITSNDDETVMESIGEKGRPGSVNDNMARPPRMITRYSADDASLLTDMNSVESLSCLVIDMESRLKKQHAEQENQLRVQSKLLREHTKLLSKMKKDKTKRDKELQQKTKVDLSSIEEKEEEKSPEKILFYAVVRGLNRGVYTSRDEVDQQIEDYPGSLYRKFSSFAKAEEYLKYKIKEEEETEEKSSISDFSVFAVAGHNITGTFFSMEDVIKFTGGKGGFQIRIFSSLKEAVTWIDKRVNSGFSETAIEIPSVTESTSNSFLDWFFPVKPFSTNAEQPVGPKITETSVNKPSLIFKYTKKGRKRNKKTAK